MRPNAIYRGMLTVCGVLFFVSLHAQMDISGDWVGKVYDQNSSWYYELSLVKTGPNTYFGLDSFCLEQKKNNVPLPVGFTVKQALVANFNNGIVVYSNVKNMGQNFPPVTENLRLVKDGDSSAIVNNNPATAQRKVFLKRVSMNLSPALAAFVTANKAAIIANTITDSSLEIESITYNSSNNNSILRYNDHGQMSIKLRNHAGRDLTNIQVSTTTAEETNGLIGFENLNGNLNLAKNR